MIEQLTRHELLRLAEPSTEICLSIYLPLGETGGQAAARHLKQLLRRLEVVARDQGIPPADRRMRAAWDLLGEIEHRANLHSSQALLATAQEIVRYELPYHVPELLILSHQPQLKPLLPLLTDRLSYRLLTLGKGGVALYAGWGQQLEPMELPGAPEGLAGLLQYDEFEVQHQMHSGVPGTGGERGPIFHGQGDASDQLKPELQRYCQAVDQAVRQALSTTHEPLLLCGTSYLLAIYRSVSRYPALCSEAIIGSPERMSSTELGVRAWAIMAPSITHDIIEARNNYQALAGRGDTRSSHTLRRILAAALAGQVETAFVALDQIVWGCYDQTTGSLQLHKEQQPGDEDLLNMLALATIQNGGDVHVVPSSDVPDGGSCAAILRPGVPGRS